MRESNPWCRHAAEVACQNRTSLIHLIYRDNARFGHFKAYQFGRVSMREHWHAGWPISAARWRTRSGWPADRREHLRDPRRHRAGLKPERASRAGRRHSMQSRVTGGPAMTSASRRFIFGPLGFAPLMRRLRRSIPASAGMSAAKRIPCAPHPSFSPSSRRSPRPRPTPSRSTAASTRPNGQGAQHVTDFRLTQPLSRAPASQPTEAWILATAGRAGDRLPQYPARQRAAHPPARAARPRRPVDRVNLYGRFRRRRPHRLRLHGRCCRQHRRRRRSPTRTSSTTTGTATGGMRVSEDDDGWSAEMLIPWHIAPMREGRRRSARSASTWTA